MGGRYKRPATPADRAKRDAAREDKLTALHEQLTEQVAALRSGEDWRAWLNVASRFHTYSFNNTLLIYAQRPEARAVAGYTAWQALGRQVDKGETGIQVLAPVTRRATADVDESHTQREPVTSAQGPTPNPAAGTDAAEVDGPSTVRRVVGFRIAYVWDVDQTSGDPLPEQPRPELLAGQPPEGLWSSLARLAEARGFTVERGDCGPANGWTDYTSRLVRVHPDVDDAQAVKTLAHEIGHVLLHDPADFANDPAAGAQAPAGHATTASCRGIKEVEAESVAYLVGTSHGLATDSYTFPYVAGWAASVDAAEPERIVAATGQRVLRAAGAILDTTQEERAAAEPDEQLTARVAAGRDRATAVRAHAETTQAIASASPVTLERLAALVAIHEEATHWYADQLASGPADRGPRAYLADRGFAANAIRQYRVGYAPGQWSALTDHLRACGHPDDAIEESGLAMRSSRGNLIDRFRDRIMLPVADETSVVGFVGRAAPSADNEVPKYLNSPETPIYHKGEVLYGLAQGREALTAGARPVIVEGPLDAIAVTAAGADRYVGVAPCGTALTAAQVAVLDATVPLAARGVIVAFDGDDAGRTAAVRAYPVFRSVDAWPHTVPLAEGRDPAELTQAAGPTALTAALQRAEAHPLADLVVDEAVYPFITRLDTVEGPVLASRAAAKVIVTFPPDAVARQVARLAQRLKLEPSVVTREVADAIAPDAGSTNMGGLEHRRLAVSISAHNPSSAAELSAAAYPKTPASTQSARNSREHLRETAGHTSNCARPPVTLRH